MVATVDVNPDPGVTTNASQITLANHGLQTNDKIELGNTRYYAIRVDNNHFRLSQSVDGPAVQLASTLSPGDLLGFALNALTLSDSSLIATGKTALQKGATLTGYDRQATPALALYVNVSSNEDNTNSINWDGDVIVLGGKQGQPELVIDDTGTIKKLNNVSVWNSLADVGNNNSALGPQ